MSVDDTVHPEIPHRPPAHFHYADRRRMTIQGLVSPHYLQAGLRTVQRWDEPELYTVLRSLGWQSPRDDGVLLRWGVYALVPTQIAVAFESHYIERGEAHRVGVWKLPPPDPRWAIT